MATSIGDLVLVHHEGKPAFYARIEDITADHKPGWYHVLMLTLMVPSSEFSWILREEYINGDIFTMGGDEMRLEKVDPPKALRPQGTGQELQEEKKSSDGKKASKKGTGKGKVVSLMDRKK
ncbi:MAG: hypothetical protein JEZ02_04775 [Desulfatibacillum sp.]|nr:hypothetical protein [Desulfatibacillum sp.]